jgi:uncharacterized protein (TIGR02266 family)
MVAPTPDSTVRLHLKCSDIEDFIERFARNVTRGGIFLPSRDPRDVGASIRFEVSLEDAQIVFSGEGVVTWVKPQGMGVKFTRLEPATEPILERLLERRRESEAARAAPTAEPAAGPEPAASAATPTPGTSAPATPTSAPATPTSAPATPAATPQPALRAPAASASQGAKRSPARRALAWSLALASLAAVGVAVGHDRRGVGSSLEAQVVVELPQPTAPATVHAAIVPVAIEPPPVEVIAPPPVEPAAAAAVGAPKEALPAAASPSRTSAAEKPATGVRGGGLSVESVLVGPTYERFTCPKPSSRFSLRANKLVNVCIEVAHRPERADHVTLVWERDGAFYGKTPVEIPAKRPNVRTRAHMKLGESRLGSWSVRVLSERNVTLAQTTFDVEP